MKCQKTQNEYAGEKLSIKLENNTRKFSKW